MGSRMSFAEIAPGPVDLGEAHPAAHVVGRQVLQQLAGGGMGDAGEGRAHLFEVARARRLDARAHPLHVAGGRGAVVERPGIGERVPRRRGGLSGRILGRRLGDGRTCQGGDTSRRHQHPRPLGHDQLRHDSPRSLSGQVLTVACTPRRAILSDEIPAATGGGVTSRLVAQCLTPCLRARFPPSSRPSRAARWMKRRSSPWSSGKSPPAFTDLCPWEPPVKRPP